jgi:hypothetical protein
LTALRRIAFLVCAIFAGCVSANPCADHFKIPNPFGTPFENKLEALAHVPVGTPADKAQAAMRAHGYELWSNQQQGDSRILVFHLYLGNIRPPEEDTWITLSFKQNALVDIEVRVGAANVHPDGSKN